MSDAPLFPGFERRSVATDEGVRIHAVVGGGGPPLLLLHGHPQTHAIWHQVAPALAEHFTLVLADLRGYGDSSKPAGDADHANYSKRVMARDMLRVMRALGHRALRRAGARPRRARRAPAGASTMPTRCGAWCCSTSRRRWRCTSRPREAFARAYWHWFFLIQPAPLPERLIEADPAAYVRDVMGRRSAGLAPFDPRALAEYERCIALPGAAHGICEDYRAVAGIDLEHDRADRERGRGWPCRCWRCGASTAWCTAASSRSPNGGAWRPTCAASRCRAATTSPRKRPTRCWPRRCRSSPPARDCRSVHAPVSSKIDRPAVRCTTSRRDA